MQSSTMLYSRGYRLGPRIGKGSYAKVKLAERLSDNKILAAKIVSRRRAAKEYLKKFLPRELSVILSLNHRNLIQVFEVIHAEDVICIITEFAARGDLLDYIKRRGSLSEEEAGVVFAQVCEGVDYLHDRKICHRDLKCENILLRKDMSVALSDFGFSRTISDHETLSNTFCGSAAYASPELLRGKPYKPLKNDVWSLGCIIFIMVTGQMPFYDRNAKKMMYRQLKGKVSFPESRDISMTCKNIIASTLEPNTDLRYDVKAILSHTWLRPFVLQQNQNYQLQTLLSMNPRSGAFVAEESSGHSSSHRQEQNKSSATPADTLLPPHCSDDSNRIDITVLKQRELAPSPERLDRLEVCDRLSTLSEESDETAKSIRSDSRSLCRMPGEACIIQGNTFHSVADQTGGGIETCSNPSVSSEGTHTSNSILSSTANTELNAMASSLRTDIMGEIKEKLNKTEDAMTGTHFAHELKKMQNSWGKRSFSKISENEDGSPPSNNGDRCGMSGCMVGNDNSLCSTHEGARLGNVTNDTWQNSRGASSFSNQKVVTIAQPKLCINTEQTRVYQEGLVTQMRRIFESKNASTTTH